MNERGIDLFLGYIQRCCDKTQTVESLVRQLEQHAAALRVMRAARERVKNG